MTRIEGLDVAHSLRVLTSSLIRGILMGWNSKLDWLIRFSIQAIWADSLYFLCILLTSICKILASFQDI
jgi:hypothetical protein